MISAGEQPSDPFRAKLARQFCSKNTDHIRQYVRIRPRCKNYTQQSLLFSPLTPCPQVHGTLTVFAFACSHVRHAFPKWFQDFLKLALTAADKLNGRIVFSSVNSPCRPFRCVGFSCWNRCRQSFWLRRLPVTGGVPDCQRQAGLWLALVSRRPRKPC